MSTMLIKYHGLDQLLVYYVSYLFKGAKLHYTRLKKLTLGLVLADQRLQPYFLSHQIIVLTDTPLECISTHLEAMGRLIKWATELSEYDIEYQSRPTIKAQALTDFLVETMHKEEMDPWMLYVDRSLTSKDSGMGLFWCHHMGKKSSSQSDCTSEHQIMKQSMKSC